MVQARGYRPGGILSLCILIEEHGEALEYDLISLGLRLRDLGSKRFSWRDLKVVVKQSPKNSALTREMAPEAHKWGLPEQLLAEAVDTLHLLWWVKTTGASAKPPRDRPEPIVRPGVEPRNKEVIKFDVMTQEETLAWLGWDSPGVE